MHFKKFCLLIIVVLLTVSFAPAGLAAAPEISSKSAVLMDATTGEVLYEKDAHEKLFPASITKIMTLLLTVEKAKLDDVITVTDDIYQALPGDAMIAGFSPGETITVKDAFMAAYLQSANDAALLLAEHVAGSAKDFVALMNQKAQQLGATDTLFANPTGLPDETQKTTAYDMALIAAAAIKNETFLQLSGTTSYTIPKNEVREDAISLSASSGLLDSESSYYMEDCFFSKTGFTNASNATLVAAAKRDDSTLIGVALDNPGRNAQYADMKAILEHGFSDFYRLTITKEELQSSFVGQNKNDTIEVKRDVSITVPATVKRESITQRIEVKDGAAYVVLAGGGVDYSEKIADVKTASSSGGFLGGVKAVFRFVLKAILVVIVAFLVLYVLLAIYVNMRHRKRLAEKKRRLDRMKNL